MVSGWQTKFNVSPGPGLWSLVLGPYGPDLGLDLDLTWDLDLDLSLTISVSLPLLGLFKSEMMKGQDVTHTQTDRQTDGHSLL